MSSPASAVWMWCSERWTVDESAANDRGSAMSGLIRPEELEQSEERPAFSEEARQRILKVMERFPQKRSALLPALWIVQDERGWISPEAMEGIADLLDLEPVQVEETTSFYTMYFRRP